MPAVSFSTHHGSLRFLCCGGEFLPGASDKKEHHGRTGGCRGKPGDIALAVGQNDDGRCQGPHGKPQVAAHLKNGLREPLFSARSTLRNPHAFGMKNRRPAPRQRHGGERRVKPGASGEEPDAHERKKHSHRQGRRMALFIHGKPHQGLQNRTRQLNDERQQPHLGKRESEIFLDERHRRRNHGLDEVVQKMREAHEGQHRARGFTLRHCRRRHGQLLNDARGAACTKRIPAE